MEEANALERRDFLVYEMIRMSGATNMFMVNKVIELSGAYFDNTLTKEKIVNIMKNYSEYSNKWLDKQTFEGIRAELADSGLESEYGDTDQNPEEEQEFDNKIE